MASRAPKPIRGLHLGAVAPARQPHPLGFKQIGIQEQIGIQAGQRSGPGDARKQELATDLWASH